ncbi:MAG: EF-hand domain-containing protein [Rhodanobacteraceae bacterium]
MRFITLIFSGAALVSATCGYAQSVNSPTPRNTPMAPATTTANKPAGQLGNSGGGLSQSMTPQQAAMAFRNMDTNHDGFVDQSEFMQGGDSGQRFAGCDTNHDGKLSEAEYVECSQRPSQSGSQGQ